MKHEYKRKPKQQAIDNLLKVYAAIGAAAKEQNQKAPQKDHKNKCDVHNR